MGLKRLFGAEPGVKLTPLWKTLLPLRGIAIALVVLTHVALAMIVHWTNNHPDEATTSLYLGFWRTVTPPYTILLELGRVAVPLFLFLAGHSLAQSPRTWKAIWGRSKLLLFPFLIWSLLGWALSWRNGEGWGVVEFLRLLGSGEAQLGYYFIILVIQAFLFSRWLVPLIDRHAKATLVVSFLVQLVVQLYDYVYLWNLLGFIDPPAWCAPAGPFPEYLLPRFGFFVVLGIWAGLRSGWIKRFTQGSSVLLLLPVALVLGSLLMAESGMIFHVLRDQRGLDLTTSILESVPPWKLTTTAWAGVVILLLIALARRWLPLTRLLTWFGREAYSIFLLHGLVLEFGRAVLLKLSTHLDSPGFYNLAAFPALACGGLFLPVLIRRVVLRYLPFLKGYLFGD